MSDEYVDRVDDAADDAPYTPMMRLRGLIEAERLDIAAPLWTLGVLVTVGADVYVAMRFDVSEFGANAGWNRAYFLSQTANIGVAVGLVVGLAIAAAFDSAVSRNAARLAGIGGVWLLVCGALRVAYHATRQSGDATLFWGADVPRGLAFAVLGLLLALAAWRLSTTALEDDEEDLYTDSGAL